MYVPCCSSRMHKIRVKGKMMNEQRNYSTSDQQTLSKQSSCDTDFNFHWIFCITAVIPDNPLSPSEEAKLIWLWGSSERGPAGKSSSSESTSLWPDMEESERCGLAAPWGEFSLLWGGGETRGGEGDGERAEGLKWAWAWPVNRKGEARWEDAVWEGDEGQEAAGGGVVWTFWLLLLNICKRGEQSTDTHIHVL